MTDHDAGATAHLLAQLCPEREGCAPSSPAFAHALPRRLEDAAISGLGALSPGVVVRLTKTVVRDVRICERRLVARLQAGRTEPSAAQVRGRLLDHCFAVVAAGHRPGVSATEAAMSAASAAADHELITDWAALGGDEAIAVRVSVDETGVQLASRWPDLPRAAHVRLQEPLQVNLAGGLVVLNGRADLVIGFPTALAAGTTLVDVKSGVPRRADSDDALWYALLDTLRSGAVSLRSGNYYLATGELNLLDVTQDSLTRKAAEVADAITRVLALASGEYPQATPNGLCAYCPALPECSEGRRFAEDRALVGLGVLMDDLPDLDGDPDIDLAPTGDVDEPF